MADGKESAVAKRVDEDKRPWKIILVGTFAGDYLVEIAKDVVKKAAKDQSIVENINNDILAWNREENIFEASCENTEGCIFGAINDGQGTKTNLWGGKYRILPLFVCETMGNFHKCGLKCPYEFAIERKDLLFAEGLGAVKLLRQRISMLQSQEQSSGGVSLETFKDWMSGVMRKYLFLDDTAHGISGYIDPKDPNWNWTEWFA